MILRNKLVPVALGAALLGGSVGAFVMRPTKPAETQVASAVRTAPSANAPAPRQPADTDKDEPSLTEIALKTRHVTES